MRERGEESATADDAEENGRGLDDELVAQAQNGLLDAQLVALGDLQAGVAMAQAEVHGGEGVEAVLDAGVRGQHRHGLVGEQAVDLHLAEHQPAVGVVVMQLEAVLEAEVLGRE